VDLQTTATLLKQYRQSLLDRQIVVVSESGIHQPADLQTVRAAGAQAVLVGESLIKQPDPLQAIVDLYSST
jgi:indole-3-glycerol phosphate synthase